MFNAKKATDMAIHLLKKTGGKHNGSKLKIMKLMYLAERQAIIELGHPMCGDWLFSLPHGPVLSTTLDLMNNRVGGSSVWDGKIASNNSSKTLELINGQDEAGYLSLSEAEESILDNIWNTFKDTGYWDVREWTHVKKNCPEWEDPRGSSKGIDMLDMLIKNGVPEEEAKEILREIEAQAEIEEALESV